MSAEIQITLTPGDYTHPVLDTVRNFENVFENTGSPDFIPIDRNTGINLYSFTVPEEKLDSSVMHGFRIRYRDLNLKWSPWSEEKLLFPNGMDEAPTHIPGDLVLLQNYPNPFVGRTTVTFEVHSAQHVMVTVTDIYGRIVCVPVNCDLKPDRYHFTFPEAENGVPPGVYFMQLKGEHSTSVIRLVQTGTK